MYAAVIWKTTSTSIKSANFLSNIPLLRTCNSQVGIFDRGQEIDTKSTKPEHKRDF